VRVLALVRLAEQAAVRIVAAGHAHFEVEEVDAVRVARSKRNGVLRAQLDRDGPFARVDADLGTERLKVRDQSTA
jgi:hypothetical protein